jgi:hypothetical protein
MPLAEVMGTGSAVLIPVFTLLSFAPTPFGSLPLGVVYGLFLPLAPSFLLVPGVLGPAFLLVPGVLGLAFLFVPGGLGLAFGLALLLVPGVLGLALLLVPGVLGLALLTLPVGAQLLTVHDAG